MSGQGAGSASNPAASGSSSNAGASGSGDAGPSRTPAPAPKAIGSLAKKPEVTRQGTQKLKFVPTIPSRRKPPTEVKQEPSANDMPPPSDRVRGRGRGRGRGEGRGAAPPRAPVEMTASGPFAMGPSLAGQSGRRTVPRSNFTPIIPGSSGASLGAGLTGSRGPTLKSEMGPGGRDKVDTRERDDEDAYSDPDEGVEIVDMENIRQMDWAAPESLRRERNEGKKKKAVIKVKKEDTDTAEVDADVVMDLEEAAATGEVDLANALDLSDSEEEEEYEDLIHDFALQAELDQDTDIRQERLYFFQFPDPFPIFSSTADEPKPVPDAPPSVPATSGKKVSFAPDSKPSPPDSARPSAAPADQPDGDGTQQKVDGVIGQLEVHRSGAVKMRLGNGIVMDVTAATQPSFLQLAAFLDLPNKRLNILGEVNKRFVVSPNVETLLEAMNIAERADSLAGMDEENTKMK